MKKKKCEKKYQDIKPGEVFCLIKGCNFTVKLTENGRRPVKTIQLFKKMFAPTRDFVSDSINFCPSGRFNIIGRTI